MDREPASRGWHAATMIAPFLLSAAAVSVSLAGDAAGATHTVVIENMQFQPKVLDVKAGDLIVWKNRDLVPHTVTAASGSTFDSGSIAPEASWSYRVTAKGNIPYVCTYHPTMAAQIVVK
jgi:plastocyanin